MQRKTVRCGPVLRTQSLVETESSSGICRLWCLGAARERAGWWGQDSSSTSPWYGPDRAKFLGESAPPSTGFHILGSLSSSGGCCQGVANSPTVCDRPLFSDTCTRVPHGRVPWRLWLGESTAIMPSDTHLRHTFPARAAVAICVVSFNLPFALGRADVTAGCLVWLGSGHCRTERRPRDLRALPRDRSHSRALGYAGGPGLPDPRAAL